MNQVFTEHLIGAQQSKYRPSEEEELKHFEEMKDVNPFSPHLNIEYHGKITLIPSKKTPKKYLLDLALGLEGLRKFFRQESLLVLGDWPTPWLYQENDHKAVQKALNYLKKRIDATFNGGFELKGKELIEFIPHLFWLIRCNASLPGFLMGYTQSDTVISLCKHGSLHIDSYSTNEFEKLRKYFSRRGFLKIRNCNSPVDFNQS
ncbi:hypothetical protein GWK08_05405 [Leptobacterium flavescens]|uniref:Uncharacterized protein n=1 Tax=Leptobacterium flavescens TaxID=472055 RepID=A0A6P0UR25_9FLAO|nr:hypothetical protein [Leptobacterium flavescens]NER12866.1 hypothetical protein [Leptobacterium flavescens]